MGVLTVSKGVLLGHCSPPTATAPAHAVWVANQAECRYPGELISWDSCLLSLPLLCCFSKMELFKYYFQMYGTVNFQCAWNDCLKIGRLLAERQAVYIWPYFCAQPLLSYLQLRGSAWLSNVAANACAAYPVLQSRYCCESPKELSSCPHTCVS